MSRDVSNQLGVISIHAPREGCDSTMVHNHVHNSAFQSTHPVRGATPLDPNLSFRSGISIHAPREGCDARPGSTAARSPNFNPRTP